jgi:hypothetical protein
MTDRLPIRADNSPATGEKMDGLIERLTAELKPIIKDIEKARKMFSYWEAEGMHIMPVSFFSPIPDTKKLPTSTWTKKSEMPGIDMNIAEQRTFLNTVLPKYRHEYNLFPQVSRGNKFEFSYDNNQFIGLDPVVLHSIVREHKPGLIIEIGSGYSTLVSANAIRLNGCGEMICIEPFPRDFIREGVPGVRHLINKGIQDMHANFFDQLSANDILFIDSTHVAKIGSDVLYLFLEIIPRLKSGVLIHIHDIFFPNDYPEIWIKEKNFFWNEQYILQAFLIGNSKFRVHFCAPYIGKLYPDDMVKIFPNYAPGMGGGSFWMRRV